MKRSESGVESLKRSVSGLERSESGTEPFKRSGSGVESLKRSGSGRLAHLKKSSTINSLVAYLQGKPHYPSVFEQFNVQTEAAVKK
jgi:hypothetical protein